MKLKNLIYIGVITILVLISAGFIYMSLSTDSNDINNIIIDNLSNVNDDGSSINDSISNSSSVGNKNYYKSSEEKNQPNNIPKKSKLSYTESFNIATKAAKGAAAKPNVKVYVKYNGYIYSRGNLYWKFNIYTTKNNEFLGGFAIEDTTGKATIF
ncbi:MAG: hypothetical protein ACRCVG_02265 [Methanobacteriaceae archaeon]